MTTPHPSGEFLALQAAVIGRFSLQAELGRGGMGVVFLARDIALERPVAIKMLAPALAADSVSRGRFLQEARTAAGLSHPNVVSIHLVEEHGDCVFFVMALVDGQTLRERVASRGPLTSSQAARMMEEVAWALSLAHASGVVHRDIKPDNVMFDKVTGRAMVTDFGIARVSTNALPGTDADTSVPGTIIGTAHYMSPEQATGDAVDGRSDLYSLGVTAWFALTGSVPFDAPSMQAVLAKHIAEPAPSLATVRGGVAPKLVAIVARLLEKDPARRPATAQDLADAIDSAGLGEAAVPAPVRQFCSVALAAGTEFAAYALVMWLVSGWSSTSAQETYSMAFFRLGLFVPLAGLMLARLSRLAETARHVLREGFDHSDVVKALSMDEAERREVRAFGIDFTKVRRLRALTQRPIPELATAGVAAYLVSKFLVIMQQFIASGSSDGFDRAVRYVEPSHPVLSTLGTVGLLLMLLSLFPLKIGSPAARELPFWSAFWSGKAGAFLFRIAGRRVRAEKPRVRPSTEPTATMISSAVGVAFAALPAAEQERLAAIPIVAAKLERQVALLRDAPGQENRRSTALAALDALRLDVLRLSARDRTVGDLTDALRSAQALSEEVDRILAARREVEEAVRPPAKRSDS